MFFSTIPSMTVSFFPFNSFENFCEFPVRIKKKEWKRLYHFVQQYKSYKYNVYKSVKI